MEKPRHWSRLAAVPRTDVAFTVSLPTDALVVVAPAPDGITCRNAEAVLGLSAAEFKRLLGIYPGHVVAIGRLRMVRRDDFCAWLFTYNSAATTTVDRDLAAAAARVGLVLDQSPPSRTRRARRG